MYCTVEIQSNCEVDIDFSETCVIKGFERNIDNCNKFDDEEKEILYKALNIFKENNVEFRDITAYVHDAEVDEDEICDVYNSCDLGDDNDDCYEDGYDAAIDKVNDVRHKIKQLHGTLFQKLEQQVYHFGNPKQLTEEDLREILDIFEYQYD